jgi:hypothetical protein
MIIRTVHHQAATGGTLISKCLASLERVRLLRMLGSGLVFCTSSFLSYGYFIHI